MTQIPSIPTMAPHPEAVKYQTTRTVMVKDQFLQLPDEARLRAFTIARQTQATVMADTLAALNDHLNTGGTMWTFREKFPAIVKPYTEAGRDWHLQLVVEQNTKQAQAVGAYRARQEVKAAFPYVEYQAGANPRPSHAALHGKIFAVDDPFLLAHTPPWDFGCNCDLIPRTAAQVGKVSNAERETPAGERRVVAGNPALESMAQRNQMPDPQAPYRPLDLREPVQKGGEYSFRPDRLNQDVDLTAFEGAVRARLEGQLRGLGYTIEGDRAFLAGGMTAMKAGPQISQKDADFNKSSAQSAQSADKRIGLAVGRITACKGGWGGALLGGNGATGGSRHLGRGSGRIGAPAPQIARIGVSSRLKAELQTRRVA